MLALAEHQVLKLSPLDTNFSFEMCPESFFQRILAAAIVLNKEQNSMLWEFNYTQSHIIYWF